jgi:hypothetical protein
MSAEATQTISSLCDTCGGSITHGATAGSGFDKSVWTHVNDADWVDSPHQAKPELRIAIDATCPGCDYPEIGYTPQRGEFICSRCGHTQAERPSA